jgi:hypothetical protein
MKDLGNMVATIDLPDGSIPLSATVHFARDGVQHTMLVRLMANQVDLELSKARPLGT